eukprot:1104091-Alexandrium_andersonii.AAC.1
MPDALFTTRCFFVEHPPEHVEQGSHLADVAVAPDVRQFGPQELQATFALVERQQMAPVFNRDLDGVLACG